MASPALEARNDGSSHPIDTSYQSATSPRPVFSRSPTEYISTQKLQFPSLDEEVAWSASSSSSSSQTSSAGTSSAAATGAAPERQHKPSIASSADTIHPYPRISFDSDPRPKDSSRSADSAISTASRTPYERRHSSHSVRFSSELERPPSSTGSTSASNSTLRPSIQHRHRSEASSVRRLSREDGPVPFPSSSSTAANLSSSSSSAQPRHSTSSHRSRPSSPAYDATHAEGGSDQPGTFSPTSSGIHARARLSSLLSPPERARYISAAAGKASEAVGATASKAAEVAGSAGATLQGLTLSAIAATQPPSQPATQVVQRTERRSRMPSTATMPDGQPTSHSPANNVKAIPSAPAHPEGAIRHPRGTTDRSQQHRHRSTQSLSSSRTNSPREMEKEKEREREKAAARQAEQEHWQKTRGAGSSVLELAEHSEISRDWTEEDVLPSMRDVQNRHHEPTEAYSPDLLLSRGIGDHTILPKILGRGKFSSVFMASRRGELSAIKHTALFPHHQLIATRLLREPTLLAELPPHPNLVEVKETIRTPGHFYLVEEFLGGYVTLEALLGILGRPAGETRVLPLYVAETVLSQLLSAVRAIHTPLQICHRDIKPENILVHRETLQLKLLDFGLATHFSKSEPKLTTCCGSPAFHCPEIVKALASPPGTVSYWGPDVDAWTCGVTMLRVLTGVRYPLGSSHASLRSMAIRAQRAAGQIPLSDEPGGEESLGRSLREKVAKLLEMDSVKRMRNLEEMAIERDNLVQPDGVQKAFKSTTFIPAQADHKMNLPILTEKAVDQANSTSLISPRSSSQAGFPWGNEDSTPSTSRHATPVSSQPSSPTLETGSPSKTSLPSLIMLNEAMEPSQRVLSYIKYCLRCAGILYHTWPDGKASSFTMSPVSPIASNLPPGRRSPSPSPAGQDAWSSTSPAAPMPQSSDRSDVWSHVQLFQCVVEYRPEEPKKDDGQANAVGFVQSILAAFGRRPSMSRSSSQPSHSPHRAMSTPTGTQTPAAKGMATPREQVQPLWLTFYMIVKFPKHKRNVSRPPTYSRANTLVNLRARAGSVAAESDPNTPSLGSLFEAPLPNTSSRTDSASGPGASGRPSVEKSDSPEATPKLANTSAATPQASTDLAIDTHPDLLRNPSSLPRNSLTSRSRKNSRVTKPWQNKVIIEVTDERAMSAIRAALSVGGTTDRFESQEATNAAHRSHAAGATSEATSPLRESQEPNAAPYSDQLRKSSDFHRANLRSKRSQSYQGPKSTRPSAPSIPSTLKHVENRSPTRSESPETLSPRLSGSTDLGTANGGTPASDASGIVGQLRSSCRDSETASAGSLGTIDENQQQHGQQQSRGRLAKRPSPLQRAHSGEPMSGQVENEEHPQHDAFPARRPDPIA